MPSIRNNSSVLPKRININDTYVGYICLNLKYLEYDNTYRAPMKKQAQNLSRTNLNEGQTTMNTKITVILSLTEKL